MKKNTNKAVSSRKKKASILLALLIAGGVAKATAEEIVATILFEPKFTRMNSPSLPSFYSYILDINGDMVEDCSMDVGSDRGEVFEKLPRYLQRGGQIVYENKNLKPFQNFNHRPLIAIITPEGRRIELTQLFSPDTIRREFPYLHEKLQRGGR